MPNVEKVQVSATGKGFCLLELAYRYNVITNTANAAFDLKPKVELINEDHMSLQITARYQAPKGKDTVKQSNMAVMEIALPSGFVVNSELLNNLRNAVPTIKRIETKSNDTVAIIYFDYLSSDPVDMKIDGFREHVVDEQKLSSIVIYDYYDNGTEKVYH